MKQESSHFRERRFNTKELQCGWLKTTSRIALFALEILTVIPAIVCAYHKQQQRNTFFTHLEAIQKDWL